MVAAAKKNGKAKGKSSVKLAVSKSSAKRIKAQKESAVDPTLETTGPTIEPTIEPTPIEATAETPAVVSSTALPAVPPTEIEQLRGEVQRLTTELSLRDKLKLQITEESTLVDRAASEVLSCESSVEEAKGDLKAAKERYDKRVNALRDLVRDMAVGQGRLDFENSTPDATSEKMQAALVAAAATTDPANTAPVSELGKKKLKAIVGAEEFDRAKDIDEPIGLTDSQVETIEGDGCLTIADLEKKLRDYPLFLTDLKGFGPSAQGRLSMSLAAWRRVHPMIEVKTPTTEAETEAETEASAAGASTTETPAAQV